MHPLQRADRRSAVKLNHYRFVAVPGDASLHPKRLRRLDPDQDGDEVGEAGRTAADAFDDQQRAGIHHDPLGEVPGDPVVAAVVADLHVRGAEAVRAGGDAQEQPAAGAGAVDPGR